MSKRSLTVKSKGLDRLSFKSIGSSLDAYDEPKNTEDEQLSNIMDGKDDSPIKLLKQFISAKEILLEEYTSNNQALRSDTSPVNIRQLTSENLNQIKGNA